MTIQTLITLVKEEKPNSFKEEKLVSFVNEIEVEVAEQLGEYVRTYSWENDQDVDLLAPAPYDRLYVSYVKSKVDYANEEYESYSNNSAQHVQDFKDFVDWVVRENKHYSSKPITRFKNIF